MPLVGHRMGRAEIGANRSRAVWLDRIYLCDLDL